MNDTFVKIQDGKIVEWGLSYQDIMNRCPGISFPKNGVTPKTLESLGYKKTVKTKAPAHDPSLQTLTELEPKLGKDNRPYRQWRVDTYPNKEPQVSKYMHPEVAISTGKSFEVSEACLVRLTARVTYMRSVNQQTCRWKSHLGETVTVWRDELVEALDKVLNALDTIVDTNIW